MIQHKQTLGRATLWRSEMYCGRTTPIIEWIVKFDDRIVRYCKTRREALEWLVIYQN